MSWIRDDNLDSFARPADPALRQFKVDAQYDLQRQHTDFEPGTSRWTGASPETLGDFSALAYFFGRRLRTRLGVPIGLLNVDLGGSPISSWLDLHTVRAFASVDRQLDGYRLPGQAERKSEASLTAIADWYRQLREREKQEAGAVRSAAVRTVTMPNFLRNVGLPDFVGEVELVRRFTLTAAQARQADEAARASRGAQGALLRLGTMADRDRTVLNGTLLGGHDDRYEVRDYEIPAGVLHAGENEIRVRLVAEQGNGRLTPGKHLCLRLPGSIVELNGPWQLQVLATMDQCCPVEDFVRWLPVGLYNRMIAPLVGYGMRAVLWYQGESDTGERAGIYADLLRALIRLWRRKWNRHLPFYIVQLPAFSIDMAGEDGGWPLVRQAEWDVACSEPDVTTVVTLPDGEWNDLHPWDKETVAGRLALAVENSLYRDAVTEVRAVQPVLDHANCRLEGNELVLAFANHSFASGHPRVPVPVRLKIAAGTANNEAKNESEKNGDTEFVLWWEDGGQTPVHAILDGGTVRVPLRAGRLPDEVRYAWHNAPVRCLLAEAVAGQDDVLVPPFRLRLADVVRWGHAGSMKKEKRA